MMYLQQLSLTPYPPPLRVPEAGFRGKISREEGETYFSVSFGTGGTPVPKLTEKKSPPARRAGI
jgi:hypothetical protein